MKKRVDRAREAADRFDKVMAEMGEDDAELQKEAEVELEKEDEEREAFDFTCRCDCGKAITKKDSYYMKPNGIRLSKCGGCGNVNEVCEDCQEG